MSNLSHAAAKSQHPKRRSILVASAALIGFWLGFPYLSWGSAGTEGASFLNIPVGARPAALGSAYTAMATDAYAPTWNPAGLGFVEMNEVAGQHLAYLQSIHYEHLSLVHPLQQAHDALFHGAWGASMQYLGSGDIAGTDINGNGIGDFSAHYGSYNLAYGQALSEKLAVGLTAKWINAKISDVSADAFAFDFGTMYRAAPKLTLAATLTNVGTQMKFISEGDTLPLALHFGAAYQLVPQANLTSDVEYQKTGIASWHGGAEWNPVKAVSLRVGYKTDTLKGLSPLAGFTTGLGIKVGKAEFAYAWLPYGELGNSQYFSLNLRFGGSQAQNLQQAQAIKAPAANSSAAAPREDPQLMELLKEPAPKAVAHGHRKSNHKKLAKKPSKKKRRDSQDDIMSAIERESTERIAHGDRRPADTSND